MLTEDAIIVIGDAVPTSALSIRKGLGHSYFPMYDSWKSTLCDTFCIAGKIMSCKQSLASGHFDTVVDFQQKFRSKQ